ncbi:rab family protein [Planoprotostelium fungivorum]|uniref:Rab family protein n=1 Tax=Planoprotostelium fungivorum TaxID=1890364 RepID=A0A2P6N9K1_9EUKA|nr:rab family protein [Planoprotostelium fungivorum]
MSTIADIEQLCIKVVLLGQSGAGKSSLVLRFVQDKFYANTAETVGAAFLTKVLELDETTQLKYEIWDTAGQERFRSLAPMYYRNAHAALIVFDVTSRDSYEKAKGWINEFKEKSETSDGKVIMFVANKTDLDRRIVETSEIQKFCEENGLYPFETSAKDGTNVHTLFTEIGQKIPRNTISTKSSTPRMPPMKPAKKCSC